MRDGASGMPAKIASLIGSALTDTVVLCVIDGFGRLMGKRLTKPFFEQVFAKGHIRMSEAIFSTDLRLDDIGGILSADGIVDLQDFDAAPDYETACRCPWAQNEVLVLCDSFRSSIDPLIISPRQILKAQIASAVTAGISFRMASELEFYLLPAGDAPVRAARERQRQVGLRQDYHLGATAQDEPIMADIRNRLVGAGIAVEYQKGEGGVGQHEIVVAHQDALRAADQHVLLKQVVKRVCAEHGRLATFMAKVTEEDDGSGGHVHCSLQALLGLDPVEGPAAVAPEILRSFIAGVVAHGAALLPFYAPFVNSYKRFRPGSLVSGKFDWGVDDRHAAVRLIGAGPTARFELRVPGADVNPYLAYAALIASGLDGVRQNMSLDERDAARADAGHVTPTLWGALSVFTVSSFAREALGAQVVDYYARLLGRESDLFAKAVTDWEIARYSREG